MFLVQLLSWLVTVYGRIHQAQCRRVPDAVRGLRKERFLTMLSADGYWEGALMKLRELFGKRF